MSFRRPWLAFALLLSLTLTCAQQQPPRVMNQPTTLPPAGSLIPIPADPLELATGQGRVLDTAQDRASVLSLLETARQNADLSAPAAGSHRQEAAVRRHLVGEEAWEFAAKAR